MRATVEGIVVVVEVVVVVGLINGPMVLIGVITPVLGLMDTAVQLLPAKPLGGEIEDNCPNGVPPVTMALLPPVETGTTETVPPRRNCIVTAELEDKTVLLGVSLIGEILNVGGIGSSRIPATDGDHFAAIRDR